MAKVSNVLTKEDLASYIQTIIQDVRNNQSGSFQDLLDNLKELRNFEKIVDQANAETLLIIYKKIQQISIEMRKLLSVFIDLETYDKITYAFYYNGRRYETDTIEKGWIRRSSSGELKLNLKVATDQLAEAVTDEYERQVRDAFDEHFKHYSGAIIGTYRAGGIGRGGALNKGHIAEGFESHTREHHPMHYRAINHLLQKGELKEPVPELVKYINEAHSVKYWAEHESIDSAWQHIRDAFGTQRGTVAGDVGAMQVKASTSNARNIRIARLNTLKQGIESYSKILDPNIPAYEVALLIADYMSEPVRKVSDRIIDEVTDDLVKSQFGQYNKRLELKAYVRI